VFFSPEVMTLRQYTLLSSKVDQLLVKHDKSSKGYSKARPNPFVEPPGEESSFDSAGFVAPEHNFSEALRASVRFQQQLERQIYQEDDSLAVKFWKFTYWFITWVFVLAFYFGILALVVVCIGPKGSALFFAVALLLFFTYRYFFESSLHLM
jgi:hypothetical protein